MKSRFPTSKGQAVKLELRFRAKPGAKFKYRYSTDVYDPEWGIIPGEPDRLIRPGP